MNTEQAPARDQAPARIAFYGRAAIPDTAALARQYQHCHDRLADGHRITAVFTDHGTPNRPLPAADLIPVPGGAVRRMGGLADLLSEADRPSRRFDHIVAVGLDRFGRDRRRTTLLLRRLERADVALLVADHGTVRPVTRTDVWTYLWDTPMCGPTCGTH